MNDITEPRKATDIILSLEAKVEQLLHLSRSQDLNIKILSNKLNKLIEEIHSIPSEEQIINNVPYQNPSAINQYSSDAVMSKTENQIPVETQPNGFRRTSRPETFVSVKAPSFIEKAPANADNSELLYNPKKIASIPTIPAANKAQIQMPSPHQDVISATKSPVIQRVLDNNGKAIFLASVEITNTKTGKIEYSGRTSGVGKWQASLGQGTYKVSVKKQESLTKSKINANSEFSISTSGSLIELPDLKAK